MSVDEFVVRNNEAERELQVVGPTHPLGLDDTNDVSIRIVESGKLLTIISLDELHQAVMLGYRLITLKADDAIKAEREVAS